MKTIYLAEKQFNKITPTETFPNKNVIKGIYKNELCRINKTCNIIVRKPTLTQTQWHSLKEGSYILDCENGFFPSGLLFLVNQKGNYYDGLNIGANVGSSLGTASIGIVDLDKAKQILIKNNFNIIE